MIEPLPLPDPVEEPPAGPNLELDAMFGEMERAAQGKPESQYGTVIEPASPPDWKETVRLARLLLERTRDLRVFAPLAVAELRQQGLPAYAAVVRTVRVHLEGMWTAVHPQLDPEDDNDPLQRANALLQLQDPARVQRALRDLPLAATPRAGAVSWRDIAVLTGAAEAEPGRQRWTDAAVRGVFAETDAGGLARLAAAVEALGQDLPGITAAFEGTAPGSGPDFTDIRKLLRDIGRDVARYRPAAAEAEAEAALADGPDPGQAGPDEDGVPGARADGARPARAASLKTIVALTSRDDALRALELAAAFFRANEPSSPLPMLIDRASRLATLPFMDILRDLAPDGVQQAQVIAGPQQDA